MSGMMVEGFLRKNHAGQDFAKSNNRRYFLAEGFTVFYYTDAKKATVKGHFDLRNVIRIRPHDASDPDVGEGAIDMRIAESKGNGPPKKMVLSFSLEPQKRAEWLALFCSATFPEYVEESLRQYVDRGLVESLDASYGDVEAVSTRRSMFSRRAPTTKALTPRSSITPRDGPPPTGAAPTESQGTLSQLDTPRGADPAPEPNGGGEITFEITVPPGVKPGDRLKATTPSGVRVKLSVPEGAVPGTILTFALPVGVGVSDRETQAAMLIQARIRGSVTRNLLASGVAPIRLMAQPEVIKAATRLQSTFRGHATRNEQQEASRVQWMNYYMQAAVGEWEEALSLAVSPEEEERVRQARAALSGEEDKRVKWFVHYLQTRNYAKAAELAVTPLESARVIKAKALAALGPCACCIGDSKMLERERSLKFAQSIREYDWEAAAVLAQSAEENQDVADSKLRVQLMDSAITDGDFVAADQLAITVEEKQRIGQLSAAPRGA